MRAPGCSGRSGRTTGARPPAPAQRAFAAVAAAIARSEPVTMGVSADQFAARARPCPPACGSSRFPRTTPGCATSGRPSSWTGAARVRGVDWMFNAWGGKAGGAYADWELDDQVAAKVLEIESCARYRAPFILEGGAIHVDGQGTLLTTEECLLNPNRNPKLRRGADRKPARALSRRARNHLALARRVQRRDRRPHGQSLLLRAARRGRAHLVRRSRRIRSTTSRGLRSRCCRRRRTRRGRRLKIHKLLQPGPLYMSEAEAAGIERSPDARRAAQATGSPART